MLDQRLGAIDKFLLAASAAGMVVFAFFLVREDLVMRYLMNESQTGKPIGKLTTAKNDVRRRLSQSLTWYPAHKQQTLFEKDSIFTGDNSEVEIELGKASALKVEANSLVVLRQLNNEVLLDLQLGSVAARKSPNQTLKVIHEGQVTEIVSDSSSQPVQLSRFKDGSLKIASRAGDLKVRMGRKTATVPSDEVLKIDRLMTMKQAPASVIDSRAAKLVPQASAAPVAAPTPTPTVAEAPKVEEAPVQQLELKPVEPAALKEAPAPLAKAKNQKLSLKYEGEVDPQNPASAQKALANPPVLAWKPVAEAKDYVIEISKTPDFKDAQVLPAVTGANFKWKGAQPGKFYWRTQARGPNGEKSPYSEAAEMDLKLAAPQIMDLDVANSKIVVQELADLEKPAPLNLKWQAAPFAEKYNVTVGDKSQVVTAPEFSTDIPVNVDVPIKVTALDKNGKPVSAPASKNLKIEKSLLLNAPAPLGPANETTIVAFSGGKFEPVLFYWQPVKNAFEYELEFSPDNKFQNVLLREAVKTQKFVLNKKLSEGSVYWRLRAKTKQFTSDWSEPRRFDVEVGQ